MQMVPMSRRQLLRRAGTGLGTLGLFGVLSDARLLADQRADPLVPKSPHFCLLYTSDAADE